MERDKNLGGESTGAEIFRVVGELANFLLVGAGSLSSC